MTLPLTIRLDVEPNGSASVELFGEDTFAFQGSEVAWELAGSGTGALVDATSLNVAGTVVENAATQFSSDTQSGNFTLTAVLQREHSRWVGTLDFGAGRSVAGFDLYLQSRPGAADPSDPCGPVVGSPLLAPPSSSDAPDDRSDDASTEAAGEGVPVVVSVGAGLSGLLAGVGML
ncbi:MAG: hypothetical protein WD576_02545, partial [Nitriliruptoraceae bacterium]